MPKKNIKISIENDNNKQSEITNAIVDNHSIKYKENNTTTVVYNITESKLYRENDELKMIYIFEPQRETKGNIIIKQLNRKMEVIIYTKKLEVDKNKVYIEYEIENNNFKFRIEEII